MRCHAPPGLSTFARWSLLAYTMAAPALAMAACEGSSGVAGPDATPVPTRIRFAAIELTLFVPTARLLNAAVVDQVGAVMPGQRLLFETRDATVATVDSLGLVTPVAAGEAWVVASSAALRDSVRVTVRYHVLLDEARVRVRGALDVERSWDPLSFAFTFLGPAGSEQLYFQMVNRAVADTGYVFQLPYGLEAGTHRLDVLSPSEILGSGSVFDVDRPLGFVILETEDDLFLYTALPASQVEIEAAEEAQAFGLSGTYRGRVVLEADGHRLDRTSIWDPELRWIPTGDTVTLYGDFAVTYENWAVGQAEFALEGGPDPIVAEGREAWWSAMKWLEPGYGRIEVEDGPPGLEVFMPTPQVGVLPLDSVARDQAPGNGRRFVRARSWTSPVYDAVSRSGDLTITEIRQPAGEAWGEIAGSVTAVLDYWQGVGADPVDSGTLSLQFHVPIFPEDGWTVAARSQEMRRPLLEGLLRRVRPER